MTSSKTIVSTSQSIAKQAFGRSGQATSLFALERAAVFFSASVF
jgi:hypothetical protein